MANSHAATVTSTRQERVESPRPSTSHSEVRSGDHGHRPRKLATTRNTSSSPQYTNADPTPPPIATRGQRSAGKATVDMTLLAGARRSTVSGREALDVESL